MKAGNTSVAIADTIRKVCEEHAIRVKKMILFGSRARNDYQESSDYDFIAITDATIPHEKKMKLWLYIARELGKTGISADILFKTEEEYLEDTASTGKVAYYAVKEGISV